MNWLDPLYIFVAGIAAPWWARKQRHDWGERFGKIPPLPSASRKRLLIHAVSVGEVNALRELIPLLAPHIDVVISAGTDTGIARARQLFSSTCAVVRYPLDVSWAVKRFLNATRPDAAAFVELELWPNFIGECKVRGIPTCIINGRLSERSFEGYRKLRWFMHKVFGSLAFAAVQDEAYAARFKAMGVPEGRCLITGSMKWDSAKVEDSVPGAEALARELGIQQGPGAPPLIVAGSTGPEEEAFLCGAVEELEKRVGPIQLLCAPRKPERFEEAAAAMSAQSAKHPLVRRSDSKPGVNATRYLLDSMNELRRAYALADLVVIGRSFGDLYGSDPTEPIGLGKATVIGPAVHDFQFMVEAFSAAGGIIRTTRMQFAGDVEPLLRDPSRRAAIAERGRKCIRQHQGACLRHAELLLKLVGGAVPVAVSSPTESRQPIESSPAAS